ncbi:hypothetical protein CEXT_787601 [Caerostris extrusa]|uniref:Uncharacterized protein n=1 Tax=Caerostris extrusa TaxID=172846 RepID=A0AAV4NWD3_CAEEX|nr:hypothetical protein CEXT_787601 [Caerostris extrusa]
MNPFPNICGEIINALPFNTTVRDLKGPSKSLVQKPVPRLRESDRITMVARSITERDFWLSCWARMEAETMHQPYIACFL